MVHSLTFFAALLTVAHVVAESATCAQQADEVTLLQGRVMKHTFGSQAKTALPEGLLDEVSDTIRDWVDSNRDVVQAIHAATPQQIEDAIQDAEDENVEELAARFPVITQAILSFFRNHPSDVLGFADLMRDIRASALPETVSDADVRRMCDAAGVDWDSCGVTIHIKHSHVLRNWAENTPGVAQAILAATPEQVEHAIQDADGEDVERLAANFPGAAAAILQFPFHVQRFADLIRDIRDRGGSALLEKVQMSDDVVPCELIGSNLANQENTTCTINVKEKCRGSRRKCRKRVKSIFVSDNL